MEDQKYLYVMISKTDTGVGKIIRKFTGYMYNHVSMTLTPDFHDWVSFARYNEDVALYGGFIREPAERYLAKGYDVRIKVFRLPVSHEKYEKLEKLFSQAGDFDCGLLYNTFDILAAVFGLHVPVPDAYTCLGFANAVMGTSFEDIQELDAALAAYTYYEGPMKDVAPDNGSRSDVYFTHLGFFKGTRVSLRHVGKLFRRVRKKEKNGFCQRIASFITDWGPVAKNRGRPPEPPAGNGLCVIPEI